MRITDFHRLEDVFLELAKKAGEAIMKCAREGNLGTELKADRSPVTSADLAADEIIVAGLREHFPSVALLSEERKPALPRSALTAHDFFLIDPLDGTKAFIRGTCEFTVNIALIRDGRPIRGIVSAPALEQYFFTNAKGIAMQMNAPDKAKMLKPLCPPSPSSSPDKAGLRIVTSQSHNTPQNDAYIALYDKGQCRQVSSSLKFCLLAKGEADLYPRLSSTMEWDTAAGQAILEATQGSVIDMQTETPLAYGKESFENPPFLAHVKGLTPKMPQRPKGRSWIGTGIGSKK